jgi:hypothetical protein
MDERLHDHRITQADSEAGCAELNPSFMLAATCSGRCASMSRLKALFWRRIVVIELLAIVGFAIFLFYFWGPK